MHPRAHRNEIREVLVEGVVLLAERAIGQAFAPQVHGEHPEVLRHVRGRALQHAHVAELEERGVHDPWSVFAEHAIRAAHPVPHDRTGAHGLQGLERLRLIGR